MSDRINDHAESDPEKIIAFFEGMDFNEGTKIVASEVLTAINGVLHRKTAEFKARGINKDDCFNAQKLALATALRMRMP